MSNLLYSSNEMYSSTDLIRKSKIIFNKIINNEIDKAIILKDGKPSFMLLDFDKYEKIMVEYNKLKTKELSNKSIKVNTTKKNKKTKEISKEIFEELREKRVPEVKHIKKETIKKISPALVVPPISSFTQEEREEREMPINIKEVSEFKTTKENQEVEQTIISTSKIKKKIQLKEFWE